MGCIVQPLSSRQTQQAAELGTRWRGVANGASTVAAVPGPPRARARKPPAQRLRPHGPPHAPPSPSYLLVQQVPGRSQLSTAEEGLAVLRSVLRPAAPVVVIGPYRSGKSFLLNQLLGVGCGARPAPLLRAGARSRGGALEGEERACSSRARPSRSGGPHQGQPQVTPRRHATTDVGFGVGHTRDTQTKGIWIWGQPQEVTGPDGTNRTVSFPHAPAAAPGPPPAAPSGARGSACAGRPAARLSCGVADSITLPLHAARCLDPPLPPLIPCLPAAVY